MQNKISHFQDDDLKRITTVTTRTSYTEAGRRGGSSYYASASDAGDTCCSIPTPRLLRASVARHQDWREDRTATKCRRALRGKRCNVFTGLAVTVALYFPDLWVLFQVETNFILDVILTVVLVIFIIEVTGLSLTDASYPFGFFFWTDCIGTATLVLDISYLSGADETLIYDFEGHPARRNLTVIRAAHMSKMGIRLGRASRIMKLLSYVITGVNIDQKKTIKVISKQLTNIIATRIASTAIWLILVLPLFYEYSYPTEDGSMAAWTRLLSEDVTTYTTAADAEDTSAAEAAWANLQTRFEHFTSFYDDMNYGPCEACIGTLAGSGFRCDLGIQLESSFSCPARQGSLGQFSYGKLQTGFDMSYCSRLRSAGNIVSVTIAVVLMSIFGFATSHSVNIVALEPLERMLSAVRQRCKQIFRHANNLVVKTLPKETVSRGDVLQGNEFAILEQVIAKLSSIATVGLLMRRRTTARVANDHENVYFDYMENMRSMAETVKEGGTNWPESDLLVEEDSWKSIDIGVAAMLRATRRIPQHIIDQLDTEEFFAWKLTKGELRASVATYIAQNAEGSRLWAQINIPDVHLWKFMQVIESRYTEHPYHNSAHAVDVEYSVFRYMSLIGAHKFMSEMTQFWLLIAAISHDVEHIGLTNSYLIDISHQLALKYNDCSPLENMHCAELFQVISNPETNIFIQLEKWQYKEIRKGLISAILHTDNMLHGELLRDLGLLYEMNTEAFLDLDSHPEVFKDTKYVQLIVDSLLHTADVGNPTKPWDLAMQLAHKTLEEFFAQGDLERERGLPVQPLNDRNKVIIPTSQIGFMEMMVAPLCQSMVQLFPQLDNLATNLAKNIQAWRNEWVEQFSPLEDEVMKTDARVEKVVLDCFSAKRSSAKRRTTIASVSSMTRNTHHDKKQFSELKE